MKNRLLCAAFFLILLGFCGCETEHHGGVSIPEGQSVLNRFYEENGTVHMVCTVMVQNETDAEVIVTFTAFSWEDVTGGLLVDARMQGFNPETGDMYFTIPAESVREVSVDFRGAFGGKLQKADRLVPDVLKVNGNVGK